MHHTSTTMYSTPVFGYTHLDHLTHHLLQDRQYMLQLLLLITCVSFALALKHTNEALLPHTGGPNRASFKSNPTETQAQTALTMNTLPAHYSEPGLCAEPRLHLKPGHYSEPKICLEQLPTKLWPLLAGQQLLTAGGCTGRHHCRRCCACSPAGHPPCGV